MRYRKLRIAWSVVWGVVAVLLCVLWVRSYWRNDAVAGDLGNYFVYLGSRTGTIGIVRETINYAHWQPFRAASLSVAADDWHSKLLLVSYDDEPPPSRLLGFRWRIDSESIGDGFEAEIPMLYPVLLFGAFAALPWRAWRFSLRTLLVATALVAVGLGAIIWITK